MQLLGRRAQFNGGLPMSTAIHMPEPLYRSLGGYEVVIEPMSLEGYVDRYNLGDAWLMHCPEMNASFPILYNANQVAQHWEPGLKPSRSCTPCMTAYPRCQARGA
jgi:hypothetical protein